MVHVCVYRSAMGCLVSALMPPSPVWELCQPVQSVHMEKSTDTKVAVCKFLDFIPRYVP